MVEQPTAMTRPSTTSTGTLIMLAIFLFIIIVYALCNVTHRSRHEYRQHMRRYMTYNPTRYSPKHRTSKRLNTSIINYYA